MVSVVIPFFSKIKWLEEAVRSVLAQTFTDFEIIVINDGSTEDDTEFLANFGASIRYFKVSNGGPAAARNMGISIATGKYIAFLDSDDLWLPEKLEKQVKLMEDTKVTWSHTSYFVFDEGKEELLILKDVSQFRGMVYPESLIRLNIGTPCVMVRRDHLQKYSFLRFSENMRYGQDGYLWVLLSVDNRLGIIDEPLTKVRRSGGNAVLKARVHLEVRAGLNENLIRQFNIFYPNENIGRDIKLVYQYCSWGRRFLIGFKSHTASINWFSETLAKAVYLPAFLFFKLKIFLA